MKHTRKIFVALLVVMTLLMTLATIPSSAADASVAKVGGVEYTDLQSAIDAAGAGETVTLLTDLTFESDLNSAAKGYFNVADGKSVVIDLNGKTINVTDNSTGNFILFYNYGELTLKNGTVNLTSTNDRDWNAESAIVLNRGGVLNVESGTYTHNGGTDMAFVLDNSGNYFGDATTNVYGTTVLDSSYIAIRNRMEQNSHGASGATYLNIYGGTISGVSRAIWAQAASSSTTSPATGAINVSGGTVGLIDTPRNSGAVSMTTISGGTVEAVKCESGELTVTGGSVGEVMMYTANGVATGYYVDASGAYISAVAKVGDEYYDSLQAAFDAANGGTVTLLSDITLTATVTVPAGATVTLDLNGKTVSMVQSTTVTSNHEMIKNYGNLTIMDTDVNGKLSYKYTGASLGTSYAANTIVSEPGSTLTVNGGTIENLTYDSAIIAYAIDGRTNGGLGDVSVVVEGGTITSERQAIRIFANSTTNTGSLKIGNGVITGRVIVQNANTKANKAVLEITGGTFNANSYKTDVLYVGGSNGATIDMQPVVCGGIFNGEITSAMTTKFISGGTFKNNVSAYCVDGYVPAKNSNGTFSVVEDVELPEAEVTDITDTVTDPELTFALNFKIKDYDKLSTEYLEKLMAYYGDYYVDYIITIEGLTDPDVTFNANGNADGYLAGQYDAWSANWVSVPFEDVTINNNGKLYIMATAAELMGKTGLRMTLVEIADVVKDFDCGIYFTPDFLYANPDLKVTLDLVIFTEDAEGNIADATTLATNVFTANDAVELPEAEVTDITDTLTENDPELTYALNFKIKDYENFTQAYINALFRKYGHYYVDYVLTIEGLTDTEAVFNANGAVDGYLAGQYDAWSANWVSVPFEDTSIPNGGSLYIMETAAKLMGKEGLRMTLKEIAEIVMDFDCGIYFAPEFLDNNPDMVVTLELVVFTEDADGNIVDRHSLATNVFTVADSDFEGAIAEVGGKKYYDIDEALAALDEGELIRFLRDFELAAQQVMTKTVTVDYNGFNVTVAGSDAKAFVAGKGFTMIAIDHDMFAIIAAPHIGENGNWWVGNEDTGVKAQGDAGKSPIFKIDGTNLYVSYDDGATWEDLGKVVGEDGKDAITPEFKIENGILYITYDVDKADEEKVWVSLGTVKGDKGETGLTGLGVDKVEINAEGHLIITYTDGNTKDLGLVVGKDGEDGVGIANAEIKNGELVITYTNGTTANLGKVVGDKGETGETGIGVAEVKINENGELVITYTNGKSITLGKVVGDKGEQGEQGVPGADGKDGVGVDKVEINAEGKLVITYTNGTSVTLDKVVGENGKDGEDGEDGAAGVGVAEVKINENGELVITYTNGTYANLGVVVGKDGSNGSNGSNGSDGKDGVGVKNVAIDTDGNLIITLTDDSTINLGKIVGADGEDGANGEDGEDGINGKTPIFKLEENGDIFVRYDETEEWKLLGNIMGQTGEQGQPGENGEDGKGADGITSLSVILIAIIAVAAISISIVAIVMVNSNSYKPWWMI